MLNQFSRTELLLGQQGVERLKQSRIAIFGVGGVGGYVAEALARSGVGTLDLVDNDTVNLTNLNRQLYALHSTIGKPKVEVAKERILDINPEAVVNIYPVFYLPETAAQFDFTQYDYVVDAIDTVTGKLCLVEQAVKDKIPVISSMGAGNKLDATAFRVADIYETEICPLAKVMRRELRKRGIEKLKVVYSKEQPKVSETAKVQSGTGETSMEIEEKGTSHRPVPGSVSFIPSVAGLIIAGEVILDLTENKR